MLVNQAATDGFLSARAAVAVRGKALRCASQRPVGISSCGGEGFCCGITIAFESWDRRNPTAGADGLAAYTLFLNLGFWIWWLACTLHSERSEVAFKCAEQAQGPGLKYVWLYIKSSLNLVWLQIRPQHSKLRQQFGRSRHLPRTAELGKCSKPACMTSCCANHSASGWHHFRAVPARLGSKRNDPSGQQLSLRPG